MGGRLIPYEKVCYRAAYAAMLSCIGVFALGGLLGVPQVSGWNLLVMSIVLIWLAAVTFLRAWGRLVCLLAAITGLGVWAFVTGPALLFDFVRSYIGWCAGAETPPQWTEGCRLMQTAVIAAGSFLLALLLEKSRALKALSAVGCLAWLAVCLFTRADVPHMGVVFISFYAVTVYTEGLQARWKKERGGSLQGEMLWLSPFLGGFLLLLALMPAPQKPYSWQGVREVCYQIREAFLTVSQNLFPGNGSDFDSSLSGFSGDGELGGGVRRHDREVMSLQAQQSLMTNIYLTGRIYDTFDGREWTAENSSGEKERFLDAEETLSAVEGLDGEYRNDYLRPTDLQIRYEFLTTEYVFAPLKAVEITRTDGGCPYSFTGGNLLWDRRRGYGTEYEVRYYQMNLGEVLFEELAEAAYDRESGGRAAGERQEEPGGQAAGMLPEAMEAHRRMIRENYSDGPVLSRETAEYLAGITDGAETGMEKLRAVERELSSYTYTRTPGALPDSVVDAGTFLDYFLLEKKEGYCTYFATAFVLLARAEGFPARYVQGFCVPKGKESAVTVTSDMAHSWPEVYLEGVGWLPFEPTPGYQGLRYAPWKVSRREEGESLEGYAGTSEAPAPDPLPEETAEQEQESEKEEGVEEGRGFRRMIRALLYGTLLLTGVGAVLFWAEWAAKSRHYRKLTPEGKLKAEVRWTLRLLSWMGCRRADGETLQELRERADGRRAGSRGKADVASEPLPLGFLELYEDVLYGGKAVEKGTIEAVRQNREQLLRTVRKESRLRALLYRIRLLAAW